MRRTPSLIAAVGTLLVSATAFASTVPQQATTAPPKAMATHTTPAQAAPKPVWATGTIEKFDAKAKTVVVKQGTHEMTFVLASAAEVVQGKKTMTPADLASDVGRTVKIRYTTHGSTRTADRIEVTTPASVPARKGKAPGQR